MSGISHWFAHAAMSQGDSMLEPLTRPLKYIANTTWPNAIPSPETVMNAALHGWIPEKAMEYYALGHGVPMNVTGPNYQVETQTDYSGLADLWANIYWSKQELPTLVEGFELANRGILTDKQLETLEKHQGYWSKTVRTDTTHLRYEVPGPSDLVRFAVRHIFEPDLIEHLGYNDEYRPTLDIFHAAQGLNYPILGGTDAYDVGGMPAELQNASAAAITQYADAGLKIPTWAQCYWWAHWILPSPTQGYQMMFRLRPDRLTQYDPPEAKGLNFDLDSLKLLLRANDYPPFYRPYLAAISHATPGVRFLRQLVATGVWAKPEVVDTLLRQGYSTGHADVLAESVIRNDRDARRRTVESQARGGLAKYYELGIIDTDQLRNYYVNHGLTDNDADDATALAALDLQYKRVGSLVTVIRRQMRTGKLTKLDALDRLAQIGVLPERGQQYVDDWGLEIEAHGKEIPAGKAVQLACRGLIPLWDLAQRLENLGYEKSDISPLTAEAELCAADRAASALSKTQAAAEKKSRALIAAQKQAAQAIVAARKQLAAHGTPAQLRKWFCENHLGAPELYGRLRFLGWPDADISRLIGDCQSGTKPPVAAPVAGATPAPSGAAG